MPSPLVTNLSRKLNISVDKVESAWKKAKIQAAASLGKDITDLKGEDFATVTAITKRMLGVKEVVNIVSFLKSGKSALEFVEDMVSTGAGIGHSLDTVVIPPKKKIAQPRDDEDLSGGVGMYSDSEENDEELPAKVVALGSVKKAVKTSEMSEYKNYSRISLKDLGQGSGEVTEGATDRLAALVEQKLGKTVAPDVVKPVSEVAPVRQVRATPPVLENRSRLNAGELNQLMSTSKMASLEASLKPAPFTIASVVEEATPPPTDEPFMEDFQNDLMEMVENGIPED